jgi:hypothetical protein
MPEPISTTTHPAYPLSVDEPDPPQGEPAGACTEELVQVVRAGVVTAGSVAALVAATPTVVGVLPSIAAFIGASMYLGQTAADYASCRDEAAGKAGRAGP